MADFSLNEEQKLIQETMREFAQEEFRKLSHDADEESKLPEEVLDKVCALGVFSASIPEEYGGHEMERSALNNVIMAEELAWGDLSMAMGALSPLLMINPILECGTEEQKKKWLPNFCDESFYAATAALMEPRVTFDPFNLQTTAEDRGGKVVLNGVKCMVPLADRANQILVYAKGASGTEAYIVDKDAAGLSIGEREKYMGLRALPLYTVTLKDCEVDADRKVGGEKGIDYNRLLNLSRACLCAMAVGVARASYEYAREYAKERVAFGEPIAHRQSIAFMLAESAMEVDGMRLLAWRAAWKLDRLEEATREATLAKRYCAEQTMKVTDYGVQILGGHGYIREHPVELWFRNGRGFGALEGLAIS